MKTVAMIYWHKLSRCQQLKTFDLNNQISLADTSASADNPMAGINQLKLLYGVVVINHWFKSTVYLTAKKYLGWLLFID